MKFEETAITRVDIPKKIVSKEQFEGAIKERNGLLQWINGFERLDSNDVRNLDRHEKILEDFIEQEKAKFFASLPEEVQGSQERFTRAELKGIAEKILSGEEEQVECMTNGGDLNLRKNLREILELMNRSGMDKYNLNKKKPKKAEDWVPYKL